MDDLNARQISITMMLGGYTSKVIKDHPTPLYAGMLALLVASEGWSKLNYAKMIEEALQLSGITLIDWCSTLEKVLVSHAARGDGNGS